MLCLVGCATPDAALQYANHSTKLMSSLDGQLKELRRIEAASEDAQQEALAAQRSVLARLSAAAQRDRAASKSSGDTLFLGLHDQMLADADALAARREAMNAQDSAYAATLQSLMKPLPDATPAIAEAQTKMAAMGAELDRKTRVNELLDFAQAVKKSVDENKEKIKNAETAAAMAQSNAIAAASKAAPPMSAASAP